MVKPICGEAVARWAEGWEAMTTTELWLAAGSIPGLWLGGWQLGTPRIWLASLRRQRDRAAEARP